MSRRRCIRQCTGKFPLFRLPKDDEFKSQWLKFVFGTIPQDYNPNLMLCSAHFTEDCFLNLQQFNSGFSNRLILKDSAVPTLSGHHVDSEPQPSTSQQPFETPHLSTTFHDIGCQTEPPQNMSVGIQSSAPKMRTVGTQLSMGTLRASMRSKGTQAIVPCVSVYTETTSSSPEFTPMSSTPIRPQDFRPHKRPRLELEEEEEEEGDTSTESKLSHKTQHISLVTLF
ncbi:hypothetical protein PFLUV_G00052410 [Perca fluviatilis]|uniref:THAP-type domain-containing protein n=1 Tax=Perca fluviatilis TaxID=8168 RepID=A0A6A5FIG5_PERFL|nr:hypothetical protein PFLUV_G00052410 [Perca fluviatilis]